MSGEAIGTAAPTLAHPPRATQAHWDTRWIALLPLLFLPLFLWWLAGGSALPLLGAVGIAFVLVCLRYPIVPAVGLLVVVTGPFDPSSPMKSIHGIHLTPSDVLLYLAIAGVVLRHWFGHAPSKGGRRWLFTWPVTAYLVATALSAGVARHGGDSLGEVRTIVQTIAMLAAYFVFRDVWIHRPRAMGVTLVVVSGLAAALVCVGVALKINVLLGRQVDYVITDGRLVDTLRLDPPVLRLLSITLLMVTFGRVLQRRPLIRLPLIAAMLALELFSYTRSTWIPLIFMALVIPPLVHRRWAPLAMVERLLAACAVGVLVVVVASAGLLGATGRNAVTRLSSTTQSATLQDSSLQDRVNEMDHAWQTIQEHPWLGVGYGRPYGAYTSETDPDTGDVTYLPQRFIHNSYVGVWVWMGIPGVLAVLAIAGAVLVAVWRLVIRKHGPRLAPLAAASGLAVLAASTSFQTNLLYRPAILSLAAGLAYLDVCLLARSEEREGGRDAGDLTELGAGGRAARLIETTRVPEQLGPSRPALLPEPAPLTESAGRAT